MSSATTTGTGAATSLRESLSGARDQATAQAGEAMRVLAAVAANMKMGETAGQLEKTRRELASDTFNVMVIGRFKNGKSTLLNALLGRTTHPVAGLDAGQGPMPVDDLPCTAVLTSIRYAEQPYVRMMRYDGTSEPWPFDRYVQEAVAGEDTEESKARLKDIREFELGFPAELCQAGVILVDSPGTDDVPQRTAVTSQALDRCDAAILVYSSDAVAGEDERKFGSLVMSSGTKVFWVINLKYDKRVDDRFRRHAWNRIIELVQGGNPYSGDNLAADLTAQNIFFVQAKNAQQGKANGDAQLVADSGLALLEERLGNFLLKERYSAHLKKHTTTADLLARKIDEAVTRKRNIITQDVDKLQQAYQEQLPKLAAIRAKPDGLSPKVAMYCKDAQQALEVSFKEMMLGVRQELPTALAARELTTAKRVDAVLRGKQISAEAADICNEIIAARIDEWKNKEAPAVLASIFERLFDDIRDVISGIERDFENVHLQLTGWSLEMGQAKDLVSTNERIIASVIGVLSFDIATVAGAATGGFRSLAGNVAGQAVAAIVVIGVLGGGVILVPAMLIGAVAGSLLGGKMGLEKRIKDNVLKTSALPSLEQAQVTAAASIDEEIKGQFATMEEVLLREVRDLIAEEERGIVEAVEMNKRGQTENKQNMAALEQAQGIVAAQRAALNAAVVTGQQAG